MLKKIVAGLAGVMVAIFAAGALYVYDSGFATVQVRDGHRAFTLPVPLAFAEVGVLYLAARHQNQLPEPIARFWEAFPILLAELEETTDATLVDIVSDRESVQIQKAGGDLILKVESPHERVRIKAPVKGLTRILRRGLAIQCPDSLPVALANP